MAMAACQQLGQVSGPVVQQGVTNALNIGTDLAKYLGTLPGSLGGKVSGYVDKTLSAANQLAQTATGATSSVVSGLVGDFQSAFASVVSGVGGPANLPSLGTFGEVLALGLKVLPTVLTLAGVALAPAGSPSEVAAAEARLAALARG